MSKYTPTCEYCDEEYDTTWGDSASYQLCPDCFEEIIWKEVR